MCMAFRDCDSRALSMLDNCYANTCYCFLFNNNIDDLIAYVANVLERRYCDGVYSYRLNGSRLAYDDIAPYIRRLIRRLVRRHYNDYAIVARLAFVYGLR